MSKIIKNKMKNNVFKKLIVFFIVLVTVFSNIPFYAVSGLINSAEKTSGIIDKVWLLQNEKRTDVVDNFSSIRNVANKLRVMEAMAAITYNTNSTVVYSASGGTSVSPAYPTGIVAGNLLVIMIGMKPAAANGGTVTTPSGWTLITNLAGAGGYGTTIGADTGNTNIFGFYKVALGTETGSLVVTISGNGVSWAGMHNLSAAAGSTWNVAGTTGSDIAAGSVSIAHSANPGVTAGDYIIGAMVIPTDITTPAQFSAEALTQTGVTFSTVTEIGEADSGTGNDIGGVMYRASVTAGTGTANPTFTATAAATNTNVRGPGIFIRIREIAAVLPTTTITNFVSAEPGNYTVAPAGVGNVDSFGFATSAGTDTVTAVTVGLAAGMGQYIQTVAITNDAGGTTYCSGAPSTDTASLTGCTIPVTTTNTQFKIKLTADPQASMPAPAGANYSLTGTVTGWTGTNATHAGTDSGSSTLTIDNLSPGASTGASATPGDTQVQVGWTNPADGDFQKVIIYCKTAAITEAPTEGSDPAVDGTACDATARVKYSGSTSPQTFTGLTNGQIYYFRIYARDTNGNFTAYASTQQVSATPVSATATITLSNFVAAEPGNSTIAPGASAQVDSFGIVASAGTDTLTNAVVTMTTGMGQYISNVALTNDGDTVTYCNAAPSGDTATFTGCTLPVTTTNTQFKIKITAKSHVLINAIAAPPGANYAVTGTVTSFTVTGTEAGTDSGSSTVTIDNLSPNGATAVSGTAGNTANTLNWTSSNSADFNTTAGSVVYRWAGSSAGAEVPVEGSLAVKGNTNGTATMACVVSSVASAVLTRIDGTSGSADCTTVALTNGQAYTYKIFQQDTNGNYNVGTAMGTFTPVEPIVISSYTNSTETSLNYAASCTNCGARIGGGSSFRQSITITGSGFGTVAAGSRSTAANNIKVGTHQIADANVTAWTSTSITFLTDSNVTGDTDTNWGTVFGGATALKITVNSVVSSGLNFYLFPQVTSITVPTAVANAAREYSASDSDGVITLNGTRFGTASTGGWVRIFGCDSSTCSAPTGSATTNSWSNTAIAVQVPAVIADNVYLGSVIMQQGGGTSNKSHTYTAAGFRVLPRITSLSPTSGAVSAAVTVNGNHLCQNNATCPISPFDANNKVTFTSASLATVFTSWSSTAVVTAVPTGAADGVVSVTSNTYLSNNSAAFSVLSSIPSDPTTLGQFDNVALTPALSVGGTSTSTNIYFGMTMLADFSGGTLYPQIEYQPVGTAFNCIAASACASAAEGTGKAAPGPIDCRATANGCAITITPADGVYHWQARVRHLSSGTSYYSSWVSFGGNSEGGTDFKIDKTGPVITFAGADTCASAVTNPTTNGATISWTVNESATGKIEYSKNSNLSSSINTAVSSSAYSHSFNLNNLDSNTTYYFRVESVDAASNIANRPSTSPYCSFTTGGVTQPAKTTKFYVGGFEGTLSGGTATSSDFSVYVPEISPYVINAFIELTGFSPNSGTNNITMSVNGQATSTYSIASAGNSFKILYPVSGTNLNYDPIINTLNLSPSLNINITSAELIMTYSFAP